MILGTIRTIRLMMTVTGHLKDRADFSARSSAAGQAVNDLLVMWQGIYSQSSCTPELRRHLDNHGLINTGDGATKACIAYTRHVLYGLCVRCRPGSRRVRRELSSVWPTSSTMGVSIGSVHRLPHES